MSCDSGILCVLGADTGVGKTVVTKLLLEYAKAMGLKAIALKPFSSGGRDDAQTLMAGAVDPLKLDTINPWHYEAPLAPLVAARMSGKKIPELQEIVGWIQRHREQHQMVLVEGVGGVLSPIAPLFSFMDIAAALRAALVVVVKNRLGAINQARMCYEVGRQLSKVQGTLVLSGILDADGSDQTNCEVIKELCPQWSVLEIPHLAKIGTNEEFRAVAKKNEKTLAQILGTGRNHLVLCERIEGDLVSNSK